MKGDMNSKNILNTQDLSINQHILKSGNNSIDAVIDLSCLDFSDNGDIISAEPEASLHLDIMFRNDTLICNGNLKCVLILSCARCLCHFKVKIDENIQRTFTWDPDLAEDIDTVLISPENNTITILDAIHEALILSVPLKPLCRKNCLGLCQVCGVDLNKDLCEHARN